MRPIPEDAPVIRAVGWRLLSISRRGDLPPNILRNKTSMAIILHFFSGFFQDYPL
jgi:hypothetical protein